MYIIVDLIRRSVLTRVGEIQRYRNDRCCYLCRCGYLRYGAIGMTAVVIIEGVAT